MKAGRSEETKDEKNKAESNELNRKMIKIKRKELKDCEDQAESDEPNGRMIKSS